MKANFRRVLSILLILCLTLTMIPGLALTGYAYEDEGYEEPYHYELKPVFENKCRQILPNGSTLTVSTELIAYYWDYEEEVTDFTLEVEADGFGLFTYEVNQDDKTVTFTANDEGQTGIADVCFSVYVDGEICGEYWTDIEVSDTVVLWPESFSEINPQCKDNPLVGEIVDLSDIEVEVKYYDFDTDTITTKKYNKDSKNILIEAAYDASWNPVDEDNTGELHPFKRIEACETSFYMYIYEYDEEVEEYRQLGAGNYHFGALEYDVLWTTENLSAFETEKSASFNLDTSLLHDKGEYDLVFTIGYYDEEDEFVALENQSKLYKVVEGEDTATLTIY